MKKHLLQKKQEYSLNKAIDKAFRDFTERKTGSKKHPLKLILISLSNRWNIDIIVGHWIRIYGYAQSVLYSQVQIPVLKGYNLQNDILTISFFPPVMTEYLQMINLTILDVQNTQPVNIWMWLAIVILLSALIYYLFFMRSKKLISDKKALEEKMAIAGLQLQQKSHELVLANETLRVTQKQLIQSDKMASLGQLTAGIAHEIQNPLNFINNFSELSAELLKELDDTQDANERKTIVADLIQNLEKITFHGKRADSIVKGMLQHSRSSTAEKQPTDINRLVEEFFILAYHGMRAKDPGFNCVMDKKLAAGLPLIKIIPQDVSRVILNIFNNSFYAVDERRKSEGKDYRPIVSITTEQIDGKIVITIRDNGKGIPDEIRDKIFNPFFTTKPIGQGTGLGLSISYDIIVRDHFGDLQMDTKAGEFTQFKITLPL